MADSATIISDVQSGAVINSDTSDVVINTNVVEETIITSDVSESGPQGPAGATGATGAKGDGAAVTIGGNTSGAAALISTGTMYLMGGNNVTLSQNGQSISFIGGAGGGGGGIANQAGTQTATSGTVIFSNSNNVSFGMSQSSIVTASASFSQSVQTQSLMSLNGSSGQLSLTVASSLSMSTNGSTISVGLASNITTALQSAGAYLTTAALSNHSHGNPQLNLTNLSGTTASNSAGLTLSLSAGNYITTARASTDAIGLNTAQTNVTWTVNSSGLSLNASGYAGTGTTVTNATMTLNSNGLQFNGGAYLTTAAASNHSHGNPTLALTNLSGTTASNSAGLTLSLSAAAGGGGADGYNILAAGTQTATTAGSVKFVDSNGITFGMSGSTQITATVATNYQSQGAYLTTAMQSNAATISNINLSAGTTSLNLSKMTFGDSNGISFGLSGNSVVTATVKTDYQSSNANYLTSQSNQAVSAANGSYAFQTLSFSNANGMSFGTSAGSAVTGSYTVPTVTQFFSATNTTFNGTNISGSITNNTNGLRVDLSVAAPGGGGGGVAIAGSNTTFTSGTVVLTGSNAVTVRSGAGSLIFDAPRIYAGTQVGNTDSVSFADSNGITFGMSGGSVITATVATNYQSQGAYLTTAALSNHSHAFSASGGSSVFQTLTFANSNGITFSNSNGSVIASHNGLTTARASTDAIGLNTAQTNVTWTVNSSGISLNAGAYLTTAAASNHSHGNPTLNLTNLSGTTASASNGFTLSLSAAAPGGGGALAASASNGSFTFSTLGFSNANNVTFGTSAGSIITASVAAPGAAAENNNINLLGANTAGNTTASGSTIGWSGINLTLSGTNASAVNISAPATSSLSGISPVYFSTNGNTISVGVSRLTGSYFDNMIPQNSLQALTYTSVSTAMFGRVIIQPLTPSNELFPFDITASTMRLGFSNSGSSNISGAFSSSWYIGVYTRVNSTQLSLLNSVSTSYGLAANVSNSASFLGARWLSFHSSLWSSAPAFSQTRYFFAMLARSSSNSYASHSIGGMHLGQSNQRSGYMATAASSNTSFNAWHPFMGVHSLTTHTALPASLANTEINKATTYANFIPQIIFDAGLGAMN